MTICPLCGYSFDGAQAAHGCQGCPMASACGSACCPRCGYKMAAPSRLGKFIKRLAAKGDADAHTVDAAQR